MAAYIYTYIVKPLLKNTLNKRQYIKLLYRGQVLCSLPDYGNTILPLKEDNFPITVKLCKIS